jgi:hypothetical protein
VNDVWRSREPGFFAARSRLDSPFVDVLLTVCCILVGQNLEKAS